MNTEILTVLIFILLFSFISCNAEESAIELEQHTNQAVKGDTTNNEMRDGVPVLPTPGSQIDDSKVDAMLEAENISFSAIVDAEATEEDLKSNVDKLKQLLRKERVGSDQELQFVFHTMLGNTYMRLFENSEQQKYLNLATQHADSAISIFENQPEYKADLAGAYKLRSYVHLEKNEYEKAISLIKYMIEEFQEIGYGPYKNWFSSNQVEVLFNLIGMDSLQPEKTQEIVDYLSKIAEKYDNEAGIIAQMSLGRHYARAGKKDKADELTQSIEQQLEALDNPQFKEDKWLRFKTEVESIQQRATGMVSQAERDTLFYEIKPDMIAQARLYEDNKVAEYRINVLLKEDYHSEYAQLTRDNIGNFLAVKYDGEIISPVLPTIQAGIANGRFSLVFEKEEEATTVMQEILE